MVNLAIRRAPMPYFRPFVIVDLDTKEIVGHYKSEHEAQLDLVRMKVGEKTPTPSAIQPTTDVFAAHEQRMKHPFGEKVSHAPGSLGRRKIEL